MGRGGWQEEGDGGGVGEGLGEGGVGWGGGGGRGFLNSRRKPGYGYSSTNIKLCHSEFRIPAV